jgi:predicted double-glycine peptidase
MQHRAARIGIILATGLLAGAVLLSPRSLVSSSAVQAAPYRRFMKLPQVTQHTPVHCGPAAMQSVLSYYGVEYFQEDIGKKMGTSTEYGTPVNNMVRFASEEGFGANLHQGISKVKLQGMLDQQHPVIIVIQAWAGGEVDKVDWKSTWDSGHYVVAIGYDDNRVYFMDPYLVSSYAWIPWDELFDRWHDEGMDGVIDRGGIEIIPKSSMKFPPPEFVRLR